VDFIRDALDKVRRFRESTMADNTPIESFNGSFRDGRLNVNQFMSVKMQKKRSKTSAEIATGSGPPQFPGRHRMDQPRDRLKARKTNITTTCTVFGVHPIQSGAQLGIKTGLLGQVPVLKLPPRKCDLFQLS
jgi:hypothetical protein